MDKFKSLALLGGIVGSATILAVFRGDTIFAAPMFFIVVVFALRAYREWKREEA